MKLDLDSKKEKFTAIVQKTSEVGKSAVANIQKGAKDLSEKSKSESYQRRLKKYNPLFPDKYFSEDFCIPNMIIIVDDAVRRDIDVCEGAIGWLDDKSGMEILFLYDEAIEMSGIEFSPVAVCDAAYYVDSFNRNRFIRTDYIFGKAHEERLAELKHIAYCLGAKSCSIEITESDKQVSVDKSRIGAKLMKSNVNGEQQSSNIGASHRTGKIVIEFEGSDKPVTPELKWFANDDNIKRLIDMRCNSGNPIKSETFILSGSSSSTMSQKTAICIDSAFGKIGFKGNISMESQAIKENTSTMIYNITF